MHSNKYKACKTLILNVPNYVAEISIIYTHHAIILKDMWLKLRISISFLSMRQVLTTCTTLSIPGKVRMYSGSNRMFVCTVVLDVIVVVVVCCPGNPTSAMVDYLRIMKQSMNY